MRTQLCDMFEIEYPIFAFTHCRDVAAAVSKAGGLGVLGAVGFSAEQLEIECQWMDEHVDGKPYGVDTVMPQKSVDVHGSSPQDLIDQIKGMIPEQHKEFVQDLMERFDVPPLPEGEEPHGPKDVIDRAHEQGIKVAALAGKAQHAQRHVNNGVDIIVAQGYEAGGHTGEVATMVLVPEVVDAVAPVPVLAAGGIGTGRQIAAAMALGAQGVWTGSLWLGTAESSSSPEQIERYLTATSSDTVRSRCYTGKPARMLRSAWTDAWEDPEGPGPLGMPLQNILTADANARLARSRPELFVTPIGQIVGSIKKVQPVRDVMYQLIEEYIATVEQLAAGLEAAKA